MQYTSMNSVNFRVTFYYVSTQSSCLHALVVSGLFKLRVLWCLRQMEYLKLATRNLHRWYWQHQICCTTNIHFVLVDLMHYLCVAHKLCHEISKKQIRVVLSLFFIWRPKEWAIISWILFDSPLLCFISEFRNHQEKPLLFATLIKTKY